MMQPAFKSGLGGARLQCARPRFNRNLNRKKFITCAAIRARWCLDIKYGHKMDAVGLLQDWVADVGTQAGLHKDNCRIYSGSVGVPESRLELEVEFPTLSELEQFWSLIPPGLHKAWSQRLERVIIDGSPTWEIYRTVDAFVDGGEEEEERPATSSQPVLPSKSVGKLTVASSDDVEKYGASRDPPSTAKTTQSGLSVVSTADEAEEILDWKGDPMKINPGDKLPFKFL